MSLADDCKQNGHYIVIVLCRSNPRCRELLSNAGYHACKVAGEIGRNGGLLTTRVSNNLDDLQLLEK